MTESQKKKLDKHITIDLIKRVVAYVDNLEEKGGYASYGYLYALGLQKGRQQAKRAMRKQANRQRQRKAKKTNKKRRSHKASAL